VGGAEARGRRMGVRGDRSVEVDALTGTVALGGAVTLGGVAECGAFAGIAELEA
jgi:hypothetical protein